MKLCVFLAASSSFILLVEILCKSAGSKLQVLKDVNRKPDRRNERNRMAFENRWRRDTYQGQKLRNGSCFDTRVGIRRSTFDTGVRTCSSHGTIQRLRQENRFRIQKSTAILEVKERTWEPVHVIKFNVKPRQLKVVHLKRFNRMTPTEKTSFLNVWQIVTKK